MSKASSALSTTIEALLQSRPLLKWAGGKTQLLGEILPKVPKKYGKYIEPFFGGGALFFSLQPDHAVIADSNPELVNLYQVAATQTEALIALLKNHPNTSEHFYETRSLDWTALSPVEAAARTIYLNRTCFNGLYRVNKSGQFNVPFGRYANPRICDESGLHAASVTLRDVNIRSGDYKQVLSDTAERGDFIFLDPPYLPISEYSDFKRYTKEQFYEEDHVELAKEVKRLHDRGCHVILTNSNHPLVHELYGSFQIEVVQTKRHISCNGAKRTGEDVIVTIPPKPQFYIRGVPSPLPEQAQKYPTTRFMGSKTKLLKNIWQVASQFEFNSALDLFSGSGVVGYMFKAQGKAVHSNDYMAMASVHTKALVENNTVKLELDEASHLLLPNDMNDGFVESTFPGLYYTDEDNRLIDNIRANIKGVKNPYKRAIAMSALMRSCVKKRPRGIFTYTGHRYDDGRQDLQTSLQDHFLNAVEIVNDAVFDNDQNNKSSRGDAMDYRGKPDLVYMDPPYYSPLSDNEYVRRYHFVEGLACDWQGVEMQWHTTTKKFKSYPTPFSSRKGAHDAFDKLFHKFRDSIIIVSYSSNSLPTLDEMVALLSKYKRVEVVKLDHKYSFGNQGHKVNDNKNAVQEYLFIGY